MLCVTLYFVLCDEIISYSYRKNDTFQDLSGTRTHYLVTHVLIVYSCFMLERLRKAI